MSIITDLQELRDQHELPNSNGADYNRGYVAAMNKAIHTIEKSFVEKLEKMHDRYGSNYMSIHHKDGKTAEYWLQLGRANAIATVIDEVINEGAVSVNKS